MWCGLQGQPALRLNDNRAMRSDSHTVWGVRLGTLLVWALAAASAAYWGLRLSARAPDVAVPPAPAAAAAADAQAMARLLGAAAAPAVVAQAAPPLSSRFALVGVLAGEDGESGAALIAVDGKSAKPYRVGAEVDAGLVVQLLTERQVHLGPALGGAAAVVLEMPLRR